MNRVTPPVQDASPAGKSGPHYSWRALMVGGIALIGVGCYFLFVRPPLLPEDVRYMDASLPEVFAAAPGMRNWLSKVFMVLGGYVVSVGILTCYVARTGLRVRAPGAMAVASLSGAMSIGLMVVVNFMIHSDFRWVLLLLTIPWIGAAILYWREGAWIATRAS
jgi:hypothetical protein